MSLFFACVCFKPNVGWTYTSAVCIILFIKQKKKSTYRPSLFLSWKGKQTIFFWPKLLVIAKVRRRWYTSECRSVCGSGSEHLGEARTAHSMGVVSYWVIHVIWQTNRELYTRTGQTVFTIFCFQKMFKITKLVPKCFIMLGMPKNWQISRNRSAFLLNAPLWWKNGPWHIE